MKSLYYLIYFISLITLLNAFQSYSNCGLRPLYSGQKIVNGDKAITGDWAWDVAIMDYGYFICGGVLIDEYWILTAAHCFEHNDEASTLSIDIGVTNRVNKEPWTKSYKAEKLILHEEFQLLNYGVNYDNDVALIKLSKKIDFDDKYFIPACLPENDSMDFDSQNKTVWITGWGSTYYGGKATIEKRQLAMNVLDDKKCMAYYSQMFNVATQLCAGDFNGNSGACYGDSGGPFVRQMEDGKWYLIGLTSWGFNCGKGTVFTRVSHFLPWIKDKILKN